MVDFLEQMVETIADWLAQPDGTPSYFLPAATREAADVIANEIAYRLNVGTIVTGPKATQNSEWAVIVDRPKDA